MNRNQTSLTLSLLAATAMLSGCFEDQAGSGMAVTPTEGKAEVSTAAAVASSGGWQYYNSPGDIVGFSSFNNPTGFALDKSTPVAGGYALNQFATIEGNKRILSLSGGLVDFDLGKRCEIWGVNDAGKVFYAQDGCYWSVTWTQESPTYWGNFSKIASGYGPSPSEPNPGPVFALTKTATAGGFTVMKRISKENWETIPGGLIEIDYDQDLWGVNNQGYVFRLPGGIPTNAWELKPYTNAKDITVSFGKIYALTKNLLPGGTSVVAWNGTGWTNISGGQGFTHIHAASTGYLWAADNQHRIWYYSP